MGIKEYIQNRMPSTRRFVERRMSELDHKLDQILHVQDELMSKQDKLYDDLKKMINEQNMILLQQSNSLNTKLSAMEDASNNISQSTTKILSESRNQIKAEIINNFDGIQNYMLDTVKKLQACIDETDTRISNITTVIQDVSQVNQSEHITIKDLLDKADRDAKEAVFANIFHDTILNSNWLMNKEFSPGRWAVGYPGLYALYRVLDEINPKRILELGLGQSTELITQYAKKNHDVVHYVTEHDDSWIQFFTDKHELAKNTEIIKQDIIHTSFKEDDDVIAYKNFMEIIIGKKFDFIFIDAPLGGLAKIYSRIDILNCIPDCLEEQFVIVIDDYERIGEKRMVSELERILTDSNIEYYKGRYQGVKDTLLIASEQYKWSCTM